MTEREHEQRPLAQVAQRAVDQLEARQIAELDVLENEHDRPLRRESTQQHAQATDHPVPAHLRPRLGHNRWPDRQSQDLAQDVEREVREHFPTLVFDTVIPRNVRLGEAPSFGRPVIHHDPHCAGSEAYFDLAKEVASRG